MTFKEAIKFLLAQIACFKDECEDCPFLRNTEKCLYRNGEDVDINIRVEAFDKDCQEAKRIVSFYIADISAETDKWL